MSFFSVSKSQVSDNTMPYAHSHNYYEIYIQTAGTRTYFSENSYYTINENTLIVTRPNVLHQFEGGPFERYLIGVAADIFSQQQLNFLNRLNDKIAVSINEKYIKEIKDTLNELIKIEQSIIQDKSMIISLKLGFLLHLLFVAQTGEIAPMVRLDTEDLGYTVAPTIAKIIKYLQDNYQKKISLDDLSEIYQLSKTWICKSFLKATNMTIIEYKLMLQINKAKNLMRTSDLSVEKISKKLGFSTSRYFSKVFKNHTGVSPLQYRKEFRPVDNTILNKKHPH
ncbi:MAG: AraC family transcriptional regulator [Clostridiales bacterium]|nr:AraC family transcriptional regulator [Clostridiales bacterium]